MARKPRHPRPAGRPRLLTDEVHDQLVKATSAGAPMSVAAGVAGVALRTFESWVARGRDEIANRQEGEPPDPAEQEFVDLVDALEIARAQAAARAVAVIQRSAQGGFVTEKAVERLPDGTIRETEKRAAPDWRAAAWYLERQHRREFGRATEVAVTGADGGPVQVEHTVNVVQLAGRIKDSLARSDVIVGELAPTISEPHQIGSS